MIKKKTLIIMLAILLCLAVLCIVVKLGVNHSDKIKESSGVVLSFDTDDVSEFSWTYGSTSYTFEKANGTWSLHGNDSFPVDQEKINDLLESISAYEARFVIEEPSSLADYGLKSPECSITVITDEDSYGLLLGGYSSMDEERYFSVGDGNVYLATVDVLADFEIEEEGFIQLDAIPSMSSVSEFVISGENNLDIVYAEEAGYCYSDEYTYYLKSQDGYEPLSSDDAQSLLSLIKNLDLSSYASYEANPDLSKYNLDAPELSVQLSYVNEDDTAASLEMAISKLGDTIYGKLADSDIVYILAQSVYDGLLEASYDTLRPTAVVSVDWDEVSQLTVRIDGTSYDIDLNNEEYSDQVSDIEYEIDHLEMNSFTSKTPEKDLELSFKIVMNDDQKVVVTIYKDSAENCLVQIDSESVGYIERDMLVDLAESINSIVLDL